ncbi:MAG: AI-2E family transporter [Saprospiraceae bacterium]|nr:MAG: permease [Candidatus Parvibacillus calidus]MBX2936177.1 AI-2E family transporter [Saprospiraceae bacterium]MBX7178385.1 AI-2E family transporter [Saprospiraceae bacterium]MCB0589872.1 AI-2E family transporter [Saprospiraceae bacterium]MCC7149784.1 AI-2E family transporter [Saprospiraceae bacterium]
MIFQRRYILLFFTVIILVAVIYFLGDIVTYIIGAWVLALIGTPIKKAILRIPGLSKWKYGNTIASTLTILFFLFLIGFGFFLIIPILSEQFSVFASIDYNKIAATLQEPLSKVEIYLKKAGILQDSVSLLQEFSAEIERVLIPTKVSDFFNGIVSTVANIGLAVLSILFIGFFFLKDQGLFDSGIRSFVPDKYEAAISKALDDIAMLLSRYFSGIIIQSCAIWLIISTSLSILGFSNAWLIGFFAGMVNVIPYLGPWIGAGFGVLVTINANINLDFSQEILPMIYQLILVFGITHLIDNFLIYPLLFSNRVIAHPVEIFIVVILGAKIGGLIGMIVAIPSYTIIRVLAGVFFSEFKVVQKITAGIRKATEDSPDQSPPTPKAE